MGVGDKTKLGLGREEKCNILFFRLPEQTELLPFSYLDFNGVFKGFSKKESLNGLQEKHFPLRTLNPERANFLVNEQAWLLSYHTNSGIFPVLRHVNVAVLREYGENNHVFASSDCHKNFSNLFGCCKR